MESDYSMKNRLALSVRLLARVNKLRCKRPCRNEQEEHEIRLAEQSLQRHDLAGGLLNNLTRELTLKPGQRARGSYPANLAWNRRQKLR